MKTHIENCIDQREKELLVYVENRIIESIQLFCQWRLSLDVLQKTLDVEGERIKEYNQEVLKKLKDIAPLHHSAIFYTPLNGVCNDAWMIFHRQVDAATYCKQYDDGVCYWSLITYKHLEEEGFSKDLSKRLLEKNIASGFIKRRRAIQGYKYILSDLSPIFERIKHADIAVDINQRGLEHSPDRDWMFKLYSSKTREAIFENIKKDIFEKLDKGTSFADE